MAYTRHAHYILIIASEAKTLHKTKRHISLKLGSRALHRQSRERHGGSWESWMLMWRVADCLIIFFWAVSACFLLPPGIISGPEISTVQGWLLRLYFLWETKKDLGICKFFPQNLHHQDFWLSEVRPSTCESTCAGSGAESLEAVVNVPTL